MSKQNPDEEPDEDDVLKHYADEDDMIDLDEVKVVFTASGAALPWIFASLACVCMSVGLFLLSTSGWADKMEPVLKGNFWGLIPIIPAIVFGALGSRLLKRLYLHYDLEGFRFLPLGKGDEIAVPWTGIEDVEREGRMIHVTAGQPVGEFSVSLIPVTPARREMAAKALIGRVEAMKAGREKSEE